MTAKSTVHLPITNNKDEHTTTKSATETRTTQTKVPNMGNPKQEHRRIQVHTRAGGHP